LVENSLQIAWDFLEGTGEITDPAEANQFLLRTTNDLVLKGERHRLMLSNRAIDEYKRYGCDRLAAWTHLIRVLPPNPLSYRGRRVWWLTANNDGACRASA
jgi:hypothetical protein